MLHVHFLELRALSKAKRLVHPHTRKHLVNAAIGGIVAYSGAKLAHSGLEIVGPVLIDTIGYGIHAIGVERFISNAHEVYQAVTIDGEE